jgi:hypothetical protein
VHLLVDFGAPIKDVSTYFCELSVSIVSIIHELLFDFSSVHISQDWISLGNYYILDMPIVLLARTKYLLRQCIVSSGMFPFLYRFNSEIIRKAIGTDIRSVIDMFLNRGFDKVELHFRMYISN